MLNKIKNFKSDYPMTSLLMSVIILMACSDFLYLPYEHKLFGDIDLYGYLLFTIINTIVGTVVILATLPLAVVIKLSYNEVLKKFKSPTDNYEDHIV